MTQPSSTTHEFPCPTCSATLEFDPATQGLVCPYCGTSQSIQHTSLAAPSELNFHDYWDIKNANLSLLSNTAMEVDCPGCHASITFEPPDVAGDCPFCGTNIVTQPHTAKPVIHPNGILPFQVSRQEAQEHIRQWLDGLRFRFAPKNFKQMAQPEGIQGVYLPFWTYDCNTTNNYAGKRGTHYYVTVTDTQTDSEGNTTTTTRQEQRTRWKYVEGCVSHFCDDVLVAATHAVDKFRLKQLEPWDLQKLVPYHPSYLAGFKAQRYEANIKQALEIAKEEGIQAEIYAAIRRDIGGDAQQILSVQTAYADLTFKHILLPVWISSYRFKDKQYQVIMNAQTGEVLGDSPRVRLLTPQAVGSILVGGLVLLVSQCIGELVDFPQDKTEPVPPNPSPEMTVPRSPTPPPTAPIPTTPSPPSPQLDTAFRQAIILAGQAAIQTQTAQTAQDWQQIATLWSQSIEHLKQVPLNSPHYNTAQQKIQEYQVNLNYARQQIN